MKIGVISTPIFALGSGGLLGYGGLEQVAWECARGLASKGHDVWLAAPDGSQCPGVEVVSIGLARQVDEKIAYDRYWQKLLTADAIIDHTWSKWSYILRQEGRLRAPVLGVIHAPVNTVYGQPPPVPKPCTVCISEDQRRHYEALFSPHQASTCYNGIDLDFHKPLSIQRTDRYLFLARFSTVKSPDVAIEAALRAGVGLDLVGDVSITNEPELLAQCKAKCDGRQLRLLGPATRGETVFHFSQAKALLHLNNRFREPFGLALVEAQACGCPVICWRYGSTVEVVKEGETGFLVDSIEEAVELMRSGAINHIDRNKCREWAQFFSLQRMCDRYESLCAEALTKPW